MNGPLRVLLVDDNPDDRALIARELEDLHQVVVNLVTNRHQAMRERPGPRRITITTRVDPERAHAVLEVRDTGPGITSEQQRRIFEPFFTTKPVGQGTGLGLSLCLGIVEAHGGTIRVESEPGRGARFRIELPVRTPARADAEAPEGGGAGRPRWIFLTGDTLSPEATRFLETTRVESVSKPFTPEEVLRVVRRVLRAA